MLGVQTWEHANFKDDYKIVELLEDCSADEGTDVQSAGLTACNEGAYRPRGPARELADTLEQSGLYGRRRFSFFAKHCLGAAGLILNAVHC